MRVFNKSIWLTLFFMKITFCVYCQPSSFTIQYLLGETKISIIELCYKSCNKNQLFLNVHDNEQTGRNAADSFLNNYGGMLVHIVNDSNRNVTFVMHGKQYTFDPNRIYSRKGRLASLMLLSEQKDSAAEPEVAYFAATILNNYVKKRQFVIALHNNSDSNFSIHTYVHSQDSMPGSGKVFVNPKMDEDDFILTSEFAVFKKIKAKNINVVWENANAIKDDGSLSIYASRHRIPYINVEAEHGHLHEQIMLLNCLENIFSIKLKKRK